MHNGLPFRDVSLDDLARFNAAWKYMAYHGEADEFGGMAYRRIILLWIRAGVPSPPCQFIKHHSNTPAASTEEAGNSPTEVTP